MIPSTLCWLALRVSLPLHYTEVSNLEKHGTKRRTKTARHNNCLTQRPQSARTQTSFSPKASNQGINRVRDTKIAGASLPPDLPDFSSSVLYLILAAAHFKSVDIPKRIARLFGRIVIVSQNYCAIFAALAQRIGTCLMKVLTDRRYC
jgi:hypothetical protein